MKGLAFMSYTVEQKNGFCLIHNDGGKCLGMSQLRIKEADSLFFKNFSGAEQLLPASMETAEHQCEDVADDMEAYVEECGNCYDYGFGLTDYALY